MQSCEHPTYLAEKKDNLQHLEEVRTLLRQKYVEEAQDVANTITCKTLKEFALILCAKSGESNDYRERRRSSEER